MLTIYVLCNEWPAGGTQTACVLQPQ